MGVALDKREIQGPLQIMKQRPYLGTSSRYSKTLHKIPHAEGEKEESQPTLEIPFFSFLILKLKRPNHFSCNNNELKKGMRS